MNAIGYQPSYKRIAVYEEQNGGEGRWVWFTPILHFTSEKVASFAQAILEGFVQQAVDTYEVTHIMIIEFPTPEAFKTFTMRDM